MRVEVRYMIRGDVRYVRRRDVRFFPHCQLQDEGRRAGSHTSRDEREMHDSLNQHHGEADTALCLYVSCLARRGFTQHFFNSVFHVAPFYDPAILQHVLPPFFKPAAPALQRGFSKYINTEALPPTAQRCYGEAKCYTPF